MRLQENIYGFRTGKIVVEVDELPSMVKATGIKEILGHKMYILGSAGTPAILNRNLILFSQKIPESNMLYFFSNINTTGHKTHLANTLVDSGASHCFIDPCFVKILGLVL
jgi:hypothetical protein